MNYAIRLKDGSTPYLKENSRVLSNPGLKNDASIFCVRRIKCERSAWSTVSVNITWLCTWNIIHENNCHSAKYKHETSFFLLWIHIFIVLVEYLIHLSVSLKMNERVQNWFTFLRTHSLTIINESIDIMINDRNQLNAKAFKLMAEKIYLCGYVFLVIYW